MSINSASISRIASNSKIVMAKNILSDPNQNFSLNPVIGIESQRNANSMERANHNSSDSVVVGQQTFEPGRLLTQALTENSSNNLISNDFAQANKVIKSQSGFIDHVPTMAVDNDRSGIMYKRKSSK